MLRRLQGVTLLAVLAGTAFMGPANAVATVAQVPAHQVTVEPCGPATEPPCVIIGDPPQAFDRTLSARYAHGSFRGSVTSFSACRSAAKVTVWRVRTGPDLKVGTALTGKNGAYQRAHSRQHASYYATVAAGPRAGIWCYGARSPVFRIR